MTDTLDLEKLFRPGSIAIVGASAKAGTVRNKIVRVIQKHGYTGRIFPVSRSDTEIEGLRAYPSVDDIPGVPDAALIVTPAETVPDIIAQCGRKGIRAAIVFSSGFEEVSTGKELARRVAAVAEEHGVAVLGTNCQGIWSVAHRAILTFGSAPAALDKIEHAPIAVISQSGALGGAIGNALQQKGIGCSYVVSVGNETAMDMLDVLAWIIEQQDVRVVALYLEGLNRAERIIPLARRARQNGIEIVALKTGRSEVGQLATASHTGKIAAPHVIYSAVMEQAGVLDFDTIADMLAAVEALAYLPDPRTSASPTGGVSIMSSSGGAAALLADQSDFFGVPLAEFAPHTLASLEAVLPDFAHKANPVDMTGQIRTVATLFGDVLDAISKDLNSEAMIIQFASSGVADVVADWRTFAELAESANLPVIVSLISEAAPPDVVQSLRSAGVIVVNDTAAAMRALSWIYRRRNAPKTVSSTVPEPSTGQCLPGDWQEAMDLMNSSGISAAKWKVLHSHEHSSTACAEMLFPLVVKALPSDAEHKTEMGLVRLGLQSHDEVDACAARFREQIGNSDVGILVQEQVSGGVEVVLACIRNEDFGPILSIGSGGVAIELYKDVAYLSVPTSAQDVEKALQSLKLWTLLNGFRGKPRADIDALISASVALGNIFAHSPDINELEANPVMVLPEGDGVVAVDCLFK